MSPHAPRVAPFRADRHARADRRRAALVLARAFAHSPVSRAVVSRGARARLRSSRLGMGALLDTALDSALVLSVGSRAQPVGGLLVAAPPGGFPLPAPRPALQLRCLVGQGIRTSRRWARVYGQLRSVHPREPHWYLALVGVDPAFQQRGWGAALLADFLRRVDAGPEPSYLETDCPENLAWYERAGFAVAAHRRVVGVPVWCMWRPRRKCPPQWEEPPCLDADPMER